MANRIKGITVEIGGDTTKLDKALAGTNKELKTTQDNLRDVDRLLKIDPKNTVLLEQKQKLLAEAVEGTKKKLDTLKDAAAQAGEALKKGTIDSSQYDALQREIIQTEKNLESLEKQQKSTNESMNKFASAVDTAAQKTRGVADKIGGISTAVKTLGIAAVATIPATEDFRDGMSKLKTTADEMNISMEDSKEAFRNFYQVVGDTDFTFEATNNLVNLKLEGEGLAMAVDLLSGAVIRFPDTLNIESLADSLQETVATGEATGQFAELLGRLGINTEQFAESLSMYSDESDRLDIALSALASNGLLDVTEAWKEENQAIVQSRDAKRKMQESLAELANDLIPLVTKVTELARAFLDWFNGLSDGSKTAIGVFGALAVAIGPLSNAFSGVSSVINVAHGWLSKFDSTSVGLVGTLAVLATSIVSVISAWDDMSGIEKAKSAFGLLLITLAAVAVAMGALTGSVVGAIAVAGALAAGIALVTSSVSNAQKRAEQEMARNTPHLADGAVLRPNQPFLAMVGDQKRGTNIEAPMDTIKQGVREVIGERGGTGGANVNIRFSGSLSQLARVLKPEIEIENARSGSTARR